MWRRWRCASSGPGCAWSRCVRGPMGSAGSHAATSSRRWPAATPSWPRRGGPGGGRTEVMPVVFALLVLLWIVFMVAGLVVVTPLALVVTALAATGAGIARFGLVAWRTLTVVRAEGPSPVPPPDDAHPHYLLG